MFSPTNIHARVKSYHGWIYCSSFCSMMPIDDLSTLYARCPSWHNFVYPWWLNLVEFQFSKNTSAPCEVRWLFKSGKQGTEIEFITEFIIRLFILEFVYRNEQCRVETWGRTLRLGTFALLWWLLLKSSLITFTFSALADLSFAALSDFLFGYCSCR